MTPTTEPVFNGRPFASPNRAERRASPFRGSRSEAAEDAGSFEAAATARYRKLCETMISERMTGLIEEIRSLKALMEAQASASRQEIDGLKAEVSQLRAQNNGLQGQCSASSARIVSLEKNLRVVGEVASNHQHIAWTLNTPNNSTSSVIPHKHFIPGTQNIRLV